MANEDFPYCCFCGSRYRRFHVRILEGGELWTTTEFTCYDCGESVVVTYDFMEELEGLDWDA